MLYSREKFFKDNLNHYDGYERDAICSSCGTVIGEQTKYSDWNNFSFNEREKNDYVYCPYCGHKFIEHKGRRQNK